MVNLLKKIQILQFIIIISFFILSNNLSEKENLEKDSEYYQFLSKIIEYNNITNNILKEENINKKSINILLDNNEYFYFFYAKNIYVYFFKENNSNKHIIYFNGITNIKDVKNILEIVFSRKLKSMDKILDVKGILYDINNIDIIKYNKYSVYDIFDFLYNNIYINYNAIELQINGFSIGGPLSQLFTLHILEKYENLNIEIYNIESWFGGNKEIYNHLTEKVEIFNIYNKKSVFYFFNHVFQKYFKTDYLIQDNEDELKKVINYNNKIFPYGLFNYVLDYHLLSKFCKS